MIARTLADIASRQTLLPWLTVAAMLIFLTYFIGLLLWTGRTRNHGLYRELERLPLRTDGELEKEHS